VQAWIAEIATSPLGDCLSAVGVAQRLRTLAASGDGEPQNSLRTSSLGHHLVVLLDINPNQKKVLLVEQTLAEGVIQKLSQPGNAFSVITFPLSLRLC